MKKFKTIFSPRKLVLWLFLFILIVAVPEFSRPAMSKTEAIVTLLCVDRVDDKVKLSTSVLTPSEGKKANYTYYYGVGDTLGSAVDNISLSIGKEMGFSQCEIMAFGDAICEEGIINALDFMVRTKKVSRNAMLLNFGGDIEDFSNAMFKLASEKQLKAEEILNFDQRYILSEDSNVDNFYRSYFDDNSMGLIPKMTVDTTKVDSAIQVQAGDSGQSGDASGQSGGQQDEKKLYLINDGTVGIFKKGKKALELTPQQVELANYFNNKEFQGIVVVDDVTDHVYDHAKVVMNITNTKIKIKTKFEGDTPVYKLNLGLTMFIEEVNQEDADKKFLRRNKEFFTNALIEKIKQKVETGLESTIEFCRENDVDLVNAYKNFNAFNNKEFKKYVEKVGKDNYLDGIKFETEITVESAY